MRMLPVTTLAINNKYLTIILFAAACHLSLCVKFHNQMCWLVTTPNPSQVSSHLSEFEVNSQVVAQIVDSSATLVSPYDSIQQVC